MEGLLSPSSGCVREACTCAHTRRVPAVALCSPWWSADRYNLSRIVYFSPIHSFMRKVNLRNAM